MSLTEETLINIDGLGLQFAITGAEVEAMLDGAGVKPAYDGSIGGVTVRLFAREPATKAIENILRAAPKPSTLAVALAGLTERTNGIAALLADLSDDTNQIPAIVEAVGKLAEQNVLMFRFVTDGVARLESRVASVLDAVRARPEPAPAPPPAVTAPTPPAAPLKASPPPAKATPKRALHVAVVGLTATQQASIEKEFGPCFELRVFASEDAKGRGYEDALAKFDHVYAMTSFMNHGIEATIKGAGSRLIRLNGGMSTLREKLTDLFVNSAPKQKATA